MIKLTVAYIQTASSRDDAIDQANTLSKNLQKRIENSVVRPSVANREDKNALLHLFIPNIEKDTDTDFLKKVIAETFNNGNTPTLKHRDNKQIVFDIGVYQTAEIAL